MISTKTRYTVTEYLCHKLPQKCSVCRNYNRVISSFTGSATKGIWQVPLVGQEQLTLSGHLSLSPVFSGAFVDRCLSFRPFSFGHYTVYPSSIYGFDYPFGIFKPFFFPIISNMLSSILSNLDFKYLFLVFTITTYKTTQVKVKYIWLFVKI